MQESTAKFGTSSTIELEFLHSDESGRDGLRFVDADGY